REGLVGLRAGGDLELSEAVDHRHLDGRTECRQRRGHVDDRDQVVLMANEARVLANPYLDVQVARRAAVFSGMASAGDPDPLSVLDPGGDVDGELHGPGPA